MTVEAGPLVAPKRPPLAAESLLVGLDALACAALAIFGVVCVRGVSPLDPFQLFLTPNVRALLALPFALVGPLGAGIERGHAGWLVRLAATLGAAAGALAGAWLLDFERDPSLLAMRALVPLAMGPWLARVGTKLHRPEEAWRAEARLRPPEATHWFAPWVARRRLPLVVRLAFLPVALALVPVAAVGLVLIRCYQLAVSRFLPPQCRFEPSCSRYGFQAIFRLGALKGFLLTAFRLARCQPFCRAGHDPVPDPDGVHVGEERG
ncbi:MAG: membrane protein insertion efficiency factor YidD [Planctomycetota bacterium]